jgi:methylated-DNA-[protein]-cysteine S-methyltransferase
VPEHALVLTARHDGHALLGIELRGQRSALASPPPGCELERRLEHELRRYFAGERIAFSIPLAEQGRATRGRGQGGRPLDVRAATPFQRAVWDALRAIPYGETRTYSDVARAIGRPGAARAVGGACGANPWPIIVPCHRVVASDGTLGGYSAGLKWKRLLLRLEGAASPSQRP